MDEKKKQLLSEIALGMTNEPNLADQLAKAIEAFVTDDVPERDQPEEIVIEEDEDDEDIYNWRDDAEDLIKPRKKRIKKPQVVKDGIAFRNRRPGGQVSLADVEPDPTSPGRRRQPTKPTLKDPDEIQRAVQEAPGALPLTDVYAQVKPIGRDQRGKPISTQLLRDQVVPEPFGQGKHPAQAIVAFEKHTQALQLRKAGYSYDQIAEMLGYSTRRGAQKAVTKALKKAFPTTRELAEDYVSWELMRLDAMLLGIYQQATEGSYFAIDRVLKIMEMRDKLLSKTLQTSVTMNVDWSKLTEAQLEALARGEPIDHVLYGQEFRREQKSTKTHPNSNPSASPTDSAGEEED